MKKNHKYRSKFNQRIFFWKDFLTEEAYELNKIKEIKQEINRQELVYKTDNKKKHNTYDFQKFQIIRYFEREIYSGILTLNHALEKQINVKDEIDKFKESTKPKTPHMELDFLKEKDKKSLMVLKPKYFQKENRHYTENDLKY